MVTFDNKVDLVKNNDILEINKITAQNINDMKNNINSNEKKIDGKFKILWENPNSMVAMNANTLINLSSQDYDELKWFYKYNLSEANSVLQMSISCRKGNGVILQGIGYSTNNTIRRIFDRVSDIQYKARIGKNRTEDSADVAIPVCIVGIKY